MSKLFLVPSSSMLYLVDGIRNLCFGSYPLIKSNPPTPEEVSQAIKIYFDGLSEFYVGMIITKPQEKDSNVTSKILAKNSKYLKMELVHKSPDFTNLNYVHNWEVSCEETPNYLNFYIYKVTINE